MSKSKKEVYEYSLINSYGERKYLNSQERKMFFIGVKRLSTDKRLFCLLLYRTGVRISEALNLKVEHIDFSEKTVIIKSLKKRGSVSYRQIPLPSEFLTEIKSLLNESNKQIWSFSRSTASRTVKKVMNNADIYGAKSCARGLRHSFAINCIIHNVPLTLIQKWMGHSSITTTSIYLNVLGKEQREFAKRTWKD